jgi:hypothetical protein
MLCYVAGLNNKLDALREENVHLDVFCSCYILIIENVLLGICCLPAIYI